MSTTNEARNRSKPSGGLHYVNNYRSCLTALVILHHTASSYGGVGRNVYQSSFHGQSTSTALIGFNAFNQSFFMGTYMYLGGYFSRRAVERKSKQQFVKDRLYRLGLPTLAYTVIGAPLCFAIERTWRGQPVTLQWFIDYWRAQRGIRGPVWFTGTLLCFDLCLAAFDKVKEVLAPRRSEGDSKETSKNTSKRLSSPLGLYASLAITSTADFLARTIYPVGAIVNPLKLQPAYLAQYIAAYSFGAGVDSLEDALISPAAATGLLTVSAASTFILSQGLRKDSTGAVQLMSGGWNELAAAYATWNNVTGYLAGTALLAVFKKYSQTSWGAVNEVAFPAFLVHMPIVTLIGVATDKWRAGSVVKTAVVGTASVVGSWTVGYIANELWRAMKELGVQGRKKKA